MKATLNTNYGEILVEWKIMEQKDALELAILIPGNSKAELIIPCDVSTTMMINGEPLDTQQNIEAKKHEGNQKLALGSGKYIITMKNPKRI